MNTILLNQTMSSIELVDLINKIRQEENPGCASLRHDNFLEKVKAVLGEIDALKFQGVYLGRNNEERPCYYLPKREASLLVMSESYKVQAAVYDRMIELESKVAKQLPADMLPTTAAKHIFSDYEFILSKLSITGNPAIIAANQATAKRTGINFLEDLGQTHLISATQVQHFTPTELGAKIGLSAMKFNKKLEAAGLQTRTGSKWEVTEAGRAKSIVLDTGKKYGDGIPIEQIKWSSEVLKMVN